jgi:hypothetical protein
MAKPPRGILIGVVVAAFIAVSTGLPAGAASPPDPVAAAVVSSISLSSSANPSVTGQPVTFNATLTCSATPTSGVVTFLDGASPLGTAPLDPTSTATLSTAGLEPGPHSITATFAATPECDPSTSTPLAQQVDRGASYVVIYFSSPGAILGRPLDLTAKVGASPPAAGAPTGSVTFSVNGTPFPAVTLEAGGLARFTVPDPGVYSGGAPCASCFRAEATYSGDSHFEPSADRAFFIGVDAVPDLGTMRVRPLSGPPGTTISVSSETHCPLLQPNDLPTELHVEIKLVQGTTTIGSTSFPINVYGPRNWEGSLTVSAAAVPGPAVLSASCVGIPDAPNPTYPYAPVTFTVTPASSGQPATVQGAELARTGRSTSTLGLTGVLSLLVGLTLILTSRRRGIAPEPPRPSRSGAR